MTTTKRTKAKTRLKLLELTSNFWNKPNPCSCGLGGFVAGEARGRKDNNEGGISGVWSRECDQWVCHMFLISVFTNERTSMSVDLYVVSGTMLGGSPMNRYIGSERANFWKSSKRLLENCQIKYWKENFFAKKFSKSDFSPPVDIPCPSVKCGVSFHRRTNAMATCHILGIESLKI